MNNVSRNYHAHGGNEWVVGGKLTFLPGAIVEGADGLFEPSGANASELLHVSESDATTVAALRDDFNHLIAELRAAGMVAEEQSGDDE